MTRERWIMQASELGLQGKYVEIENKYQEILFIRRIDRKDIVKCAAPSTNKGKRSRGTARR